MTNLVNNLKELRALKQYCIIGNTNQQHEILSYFRLKEAWIEEFSTPFHERLTVKEQLKFYIKWFNYDESAESLLKKFDLLEYQNMKVKKLDYDEYVLLKVALALVQDREYVVFKDILHNLKVETIDQLLNVMPLFKENHNVLQVLSYIDHAILLSDQVYQVKKEQLKQLEIYVDEQENIQSLKLSDGEQKQNENISKEDTQQDISQEINQQLIRSNVFRISVKSEDKTIFINPEDIDYIEGAEGKVNIIINNESFKADYTLNDLENKLKVYGFYRCHRSYIINLQKVKEMITWSKNSYSIKIDGLENTFVPLSRNKVKEIQGYFNSQEVQFTKS
ncbi:LytTR family DNA-binding domain-containing protein [Macrococcus equi]|uniref:LytTR family DNA-binding domain-containing protein n=1 Tax=Macrococcus equi TaxID=3395462 RepID=UPI0039BE5FFB